MTEASDNLVLVTGATGYIGGRLIPRLLDQGYRVRALARNPAKLKDSPWHHEVEVFQGDPLHPETLPCALAGTMATFYLIHSMTGGQDFREQDITAARNFGQAAKAADVRRIVYLGGLGDPRATLSEHLASRQETGNALRESGVPVTEFRAAVVVGSGSISFEMIRYLTERIPVMICPRWVYTRVQPIAIEDVLRYLMAAITRTEAAGEIVEIGGADILTYGDMMVRYARVRGLPRLLIPVPVLTPRLSSYWVHWVTPIRAAYARPLIEGLRNEVVVRDDKAAALFPKIRPTGYETAVRRALDELRAEWLAPGLQTEQPTQKKVELFSRNGMIVERRRVQVNAPAADVYRIISELGGTNGWPSFNWAWRLRGLFDHLIGGIGLRRSRPTRLELCPGDVVDFYRVEAVEPGHLLRLRVEMRLPGEGWVQFEAQPRGAGESTLVQTMFFAPRGLAGLMYWYLLFPAHWLIFTCMLRKLAHMAEAIRATTLSSAGPPMSSE